MKRPVYPSGFRARGFTLLEVLAAMALLSLLLLGIWSGIHTATLSIRSGQRFAERTDAVRSAQDFLRRELAQASSQPWSSQSDGSAVVFTGSPRELRFVAPLPGYLGKLGPQLQTLRLVPDGTSRGYRLEVGFALLPPDGSPPKPLGKPQVLLTGIRRGEFSYRGFDDQRHPTGWKMRWGAPERVPALVRVDLEMDHGSWPLLLAPVRIDPRAVNDAGGMLRRIIHPSRGGP